MMITREMWLAGAERADHYPPGNGYTFVAGEAASLSSGVRELLIRRGPTYVSEHG